MTKILPGPDGALSELLGLVRAADSVELKHTVPDSAHRSAIDALGLDPLDAEIRQVFFFDTPDLALDAQGVVLRARRMQRKGGDSVAKLRPVVPAALPPALRELPGFKVEVDAMPGGYVCSGSLRRMISAAHVAGAVRGDRPVRKLFSSEQRAFATEHAPGLDFEALLVLGPIFVLKLRVDPADLGRRLVAEAWLYPDGSRVLELSTKCPPGETFQAAAETRAFLEDLGLDLDVEQMTKTRHALEVLGGQRRASALSSST